MNVTPVRRRDLHRPVMVTGEVPAEHGAKDDPRYPSKRVLRQFLSFVIDLVVHFAVPFGIAYALDMREPGITGGQFNLICALGFLAMSILDRVFIQWITRASIGKLITALRMIREDNGGRPTLWDMVKAWLMSVALAFQAFASLG